jgi:hypothetical protein
MTTMKREKPHSLKISCRGLLADAQGPGGLLALVVIAALVLTAVLFRGF